jgi:tetratricopeptide (TPR) repeat protein
LTRALLLAWACFGVGLLPVMGFVDVFYMKYTLVSDHYQYIAMIAVAAVIGAAISVAARNAGARKFFTAAGAVLLIVLSALSWNQAHLYADAETLYRQTLAANPSAWVLEYNLGVLLQNRSMTETVEHFRSVARQQPGFVPVHETLCHAARLGQRADEAQTECARAIQNAPDSATLHSALGWALLSHHDIVHARSELERAVQLDDSLPDAHFSLGALYLATGRPADAAVQYRSALKAVPASAAGHNDLGEALSESGDQEGADQAFREAIRLRPQFALAHANLGDLLQTTGRSREAEKEYREAIRDDPSAAEPHNNLAVLLIHLGHPDEALGELQLALKLQPDTPGARANLNRLLASRSVGAGKR